MEGVESGQAWSSAHALIRTALARAEYGCPLHACCRDLAHGCRWIDGPVDAATSRGSRRAQRLPVVLLHHAAVGTFRPRFPVIVILGTVASRRPKGSHDPEGSVSMCMIVRPLRRTRPAQPTPARLRGHRQHPLAGSAQHRSAAAWPSPTRIANLLRGGQPAQQTQSVGRSAGTHRSPGMHQLEPCLLLSSVGGRARQASGPPVSPAHLNGG